MSFADKLNKAIENAPEAGFVQINYGKLTTEINVLTWQGKGEKPLVEAYDDDTDLSKGQGLEIIFHVDIAELNPAIDFDYTRKVRIIKSGKTLKSDWSEITEPSLVKVFGKNWGDVISSGKAIYVAIEDEPNVNGNKTKQKEDGTPGRVLGVPKFVEKFANKKACQVARDERFGKGSAVSTDDDEGEDEDGIPAAIVKKAKKLWISVDEDKETFLELMESAPYDDYAKKELLKAVQE